MSNIDFQNGFAAGYSMGVNNLNIELTSQRDTEANWKTLNPIIPEGNWAVVEMSNGYIRIKVGDGKTSFTDLPYTDEQISEDLELLEENVNRLAATLAQEISDTDTAISELQGSIKTSETTSKMYADLGIQNLQTAIQGSLDRKAALDENGIILASQLPSYVDDVVNSYIDSEATEFSSSWLKDESGKVIAPETGKIYVILSEGPLNGAQYRWSGSIYVSCNPGSVVSVNGKSGIVNLTSSDVGAEPSGSEQRANAHANALVGALSDYWQYGSGVNSIIGAINKDADWALGKFEQSGNKIQDLFSYTDSTTTYPSSKAAYDLVKFVYDLVMPVTIYSDSTGFECHNKDPGDGWQLTGLNLSQFKRLKFYVRSADSGSSQSPSHIVEMHLDDRCRGDNSYFTAGHTTIYPESEARTHNVIFTVSGDKTSIAFSKCHRISASTAATSLGGRNCYLIEGYYI